MRVLVTGGVRSGKSRHAEALLAGASTVTYVAPGPTPDRETDPDWADRIASHQAHRPAHWVTLETADLAPALARDGAIIVDCMGTWLAAVIDAHDLWERPSDEVTDTALGLLDEVVATLTARSDVAGVADVVIVTNEVGLGVVPEHRSGRLFRDVLGLINQRLAQACDEVHLVVAGRVLVL